MKYKYLVTSDMRQNLNKMNLSHVILQTIARDERRETPFPKTQIFKNKKVYRQRIQTDGAARLVFFEEKREDIDCTIYVLRQVYKTHDDYEKEILEMDIHEWVEYYEYSENEQFELELAFEDMCIVEDRKKLPEAYRVYEKKPRRFDEAQEGIVYEMPEWVNEFSDMDGFDQSDIYDLLFKLVVDEDWSVENSTDEYGFIHAKKTLNSNYEIIFRYDENKKDFYLLALGEKVNVKELVEHKYNGTIATLSRKSRKCYPNFILCESKLWIAIEKDNQANLALSEEELSTLQDIEYPFFVSGLAGSGKSTILYYLFAHAYDYVCTHNRGHKLLFLSYSTKLVSNAKDIVKSILCYNHAYNRKDYFNEKDNQNAFDECFQPFQDFIKAEFLVDDEYEKFSKDNYIDYQKFKDLYETDCQLREKKKLSADIVWSVIRTYIKGKDGSRYFTPNDYENEQKSKDITVEKTDYETIYKIWDNWYRKKYEKDGMWDDLDLVRYALSKDISEENFHQYAVVFCDEAQDFTKVETDLIIKLSVHSNYDLSTNKEDTLIPIAFAGDPNQTINPTGFRWGSAQEIFNSSFKECLKSFAGFEPHELRKNYRSKEGIVRFANTIQMIRYRYLMSGKTSMTFQEAWDSETNETSDENEKLAYVAYYSLDEHRDRILEGMSKAIIITADEGEYDMESEIADEDLRGHVTNDKLFTAITSKGLEFKATILYKFSSDPAVSLFEKVVNGGQLTNDSEKYRLSHFFTKLYIAVSRAKQVLFVVDTADGYDKLWKYFTDDESWNNVLDNLKKDKYITTDLGRLSKGNIEDFAHKLDANYKPREHAENLFKVALNGDGLTGDRDTMNRARSAYKDAKYENKAKLCEAYMSLFDKEYEIAGKKFENISEYKLALKSYWAGQCWELVLEASNKVSEIDDEFEVNRVVAQFMSNEIDVIEFVRQWKENIDDFQDSTSKLTNRELWLKVINKVKTESLSLDAAYLTDKFIRFVDSLSEYVRWFEDGMISTRAILHFRRAQFANNGLTRNDVDFNIEHYLKAIQLWEKGSGYENNKDYIYAQRQTVKTDSEEIVLIDKLGESEEIIKKFGQNEKANSLTPDAKMIVFNALLEHDFNAAYAYPYPVGENKWNYLYDANKLMFMSDVVLKDFDLKKYYFFEEKFKLEDSDVNDFIDKDNIDKIVNLVGEDITGKPYWAFFLNDLQNAEGEKVVKKYIERNLLLDSFAAKLRSTGCQNKIMASCFMDLLFDKTFNDRRAEKFRDILVKIWELGNFLRIDFRIGTDTNKYFTSYGKLNGDEVDRIKANIQKYIKSVVNGCKKVTMSSKDDFINLLTAFEISVPYVSKEPDYEVLAKFFGGMLKNDKFGVIKSQVSLCFVLYQFLADCNTRNGSYNNLVTALKDHDLTVKGMIEDLDQEEAISLIVALFMSLDEMTDEATLLCAKLLYKHKLTAEDFKPYCKVIDLRNYASATVDMVINNKLSSRKKIVNYEFKLLSFIWEALFDYKYVAAHYNNLVGQKRFAKLRNLRDYFKKRALLYYSNFTDDSFYDMQDEYKIKMSMKTLPEAIPVIEESDDETKGEETKKESSESTIEDKPKATPKKTKKKEENSSASNQQKQIMIDMAVKMISMGMEDCTIQELTGLTPKEIKTLRKK